MADPHVIAREILVDLPDDAMGHLPMHNVIPRLSATPVAAPPGARLGRARRRDPRALGLDRAELAGLPATASSPSRERCRDAATLPVWPLLLFVPVTAQRFRWRSTAWRRRDHSRSGGQRRRLGEGAARTLVPEAAEIVARGGADVVGPHQSAAAPAVRDIEAAVGPGVLALALPKTDSAEHVRSSPRLSTRSRSSAA